MHLVNTDGVAITLTAPRWEFPPEGDENDDAWLIISGHIDLVDRKWSFDEACLQMAEAQELVRWLQDAGDGRINPEPEKDDDTPEPALSFLEPALGFSVCNHHEDELDVRIFFTAEAAPPWLREQDPHHARHIVGMRMRRDQLLTAAEDWRQELDALPARPWIQAG